MTAGSEPKPQEHAARLLEVAEVVHESHHDRREILGMIMDDQIFSSNSTVESSLNQSTSHGGETTTTLPTKETDEKPKKDRRPRSQTVAELKQQLQDCHNALLTMRENANLKYRKLELEFVDLKSALSATRAELDAAKVECQNLEKEKNMLSDKLSKAVGDEKAAWLDNLQESNSQLERELSVAKLEREEKARSNEELRAIMRACQRCRRNLPQTQPGLSKSTSVRTLWGWETLTGAFVGGLNEEAEATPSPQGTRKLLDGSRPQPPPEMFTFMEQSQRIKEDLEADIEEMERQMKDDIENLKNEWAKSPKVYHRGRGASKKSEKHKKKSKKKSSKAMSSLDSFFSSATAGLEDEEMDEEKSFFSMSRSVKTDSHVEKGRRKKHKHKHRKKSSQAATDEDVDRRVAFKSDGKGLSLRDNLQEKLIGLGQEQVPRQNSFFRTSRSSDETEFSDADDRGGNNETDHFDEMARQVEAWGVEASRSTTVL